MTIKNKTEIKYDNTPFSMEGSIVSIKNEGNKELKQPVRFVVRLEESGDFISCVTWNFELLEQLKTLSKFLYVCKVKAVATMYKEQPSIRVGEVESVTSTKSKYADLEEIKPSIEIEVNNFIEAHIKDEDFRKLLSILIINNKEFFTHPAARSMHHNYPGGLAKHSLSVAKRCLSTYEIYSEGKLINKDLLLTGALLHDIGKIKEYTKEGQISFSGEFETHLTSGATIIEKAAKVAEIKVDSEKINFLKHIIMSHHGKLEFGSPVLPKIIEAVIVANADDGDAKLASVIEELKVTSDGEFTETIKIIEGGRIYKH